MKKLLLFVICATCTQWAQAEISIGGDATVAFAAVDEGKALLVESDEFVRGMSPFDRSARLKTDREVSEKQYLEFVGQNVLAWEDAEKQKITDALQGTQDSFKALALPFPKRVLLIKSTGNEEGHAAYTRGHAIILPQNELEGPVEKVRKLVCHELFHILSRANPELREKLYAAIGFVKCGEVFPAELNARKITNPDAPWNDHCIHIRVKGAACWGVPILFSSSDKYDLAKGGEFFDYLQFQLLLVEKGASGAVAKPLYDGKDLRLVDMRQVAGFFEQVGKNTGYIIHPEEILADNFALLVLNESKIPSPEVLKKVEGVLKGK